MLGLLALAASAHPMLPDDVDRDAACLVATTTALYYFHRETEADQQQMHQLREDFESALTFFSGSLTRVLNGADLDRTVAAARSVIIALPVRDQQQLVPDCLANMRAKIGSIKQAMLKK